MIYVNIRSITLLSIKKVGGHQKIVRYLSSQVLFKIFWQLLLTCAFLLLCALNRQHTKHPELLLVLEDESYSLLHFL